MTEFNQAKGKWKAAEAVSKEAEKERKKRLLKSWLNCNQA